MIRIVVVSFVLKKIVTLEVENVTHIHVQVLVHVHTHTHTYTHTHTHTHEDYRNCTVPAASFVFHSLVESCYSSN